MENTLAKVQALLKVPKGNLNSFGNYKFRSAEDILEAVKPIVNPLGYYVNCTDGIVEIGGRVYVKATAVLSNGNESWSADGFAREEETLKGQIAAQITGGASSYARKYALNGLFAIDDTKDPDHTNDGKEVKAPQKDSSKPDPKTPVKKPWLNPNTKEWTDAVERIKNGTPLDQVESFFLISKVNKEKLATESAVK